MCEEQGLDPSGTKDVLIDRLKAHEKESESHKDDVDGQKGNDDAEGSARRRGRRMRIRMMMVSRSLKV